MKTVLILIFSSLIFLCSCGDDGRELIATAQRLRPSFKKDVLYDCWIIENSLVSWRANVNLLYYYQNLSCYHDNKEKV